MSERISASRVMLAEPDTIFAVLIDPDGHVAIDSSGMLQGATGAPITTDRMRAWSVYVQSIA